MKADKLVLRCFGELEAGQWSIVCLDLNLAAQADTFEEAKASLDGMIREYIEEALTSDRDHADELLNRKAPLSIFAKYYFHYFMHHMNRAKEAAKEKTFKEVLPLKVA